MKRIPWNESKHPRDEKGKFKPTVGGSKHFRWLRRYVGRLPGADTPVSVQLLDQTATRDHRNPGDYVVARGFVPARIKLYLSAINGKMNRKHIAGYDISRPAFARNVLLHELGHHKVETLSDKMRERTFKLARSIKTPPIKYYARTMEPDVLEYEKAAEYFAKKWGARWRVNKPARLAR